MGINEFKLEFYFNLYKDKPLKNRDEFRKNFKKAHGNFLYLPELIVRIEKYQIKKYGETLNNFVYIPNRNERRKNNYRVNAEQKKEIRQMIKFIRELKIVLKENEKMSSLLTVVVCFGLMGIFIILEIIWR